MIVDVRATKLQQALLETDTYIIYENNYQVYVALFKEKYVISMKDLKITTKPKRLT